MPIQFRCPACHKPLSVASRLAGKSLTCPACEGNLTVPLETAQEKHSAPDPLPGEKASAGRQRRLSVAILAGVVLIIAIGLVAGIPGALPGKDPETEQTEEQPGSQPILEAESQTVARSAQLPDEKEKPPALPNEPARVAPQALPRVETSAPQTPEQQPKQAGGNQAVLVASPPAQDAAPAAKVQPPQAEKKSPEGVRERWTSKRRSRLTDEELRRQLLLPPEVDLEAVPGTSKKMIAVSGKTAGTGQDVVPQFTSRRADLIGLPLHAGNLARMGLEEALNLKVLSQRLRLTIQSALPNVPDNVIDPRPDPEVLRQRLVNNPQQAIWFRPQAIATLRQLLMHEHRNVRLVLVDILAKIEGGLASMALAERAVFDLDPDVRLTALVALKSRPTAEYESALIAGLRYPWPAVADHAAEALVSLDLRDAIPKLLTLLDVRDLGEPYPVSLGQTRQAVVPELVRINHLRNCLLCHAYSASPADPIRGVAPNADHLVPLPATGARTASKWSKGGGSTVSVAATTFVRPDITFFRQDFSVLQPVPNHGRLWPSDQRFDYLIRLRPLNTRELSVWQDKLKDFRTAAPQREALLFALRELTGENPGPSAEDWMRLYSPLTGRRLEKPLAPSEQVVHVRNFLTEASPLQQMERLQAFKDKSGTVYDTALVLAIPQMTPEVQKSARTILADRFFCLSVKELGEKLRDPDAEVRRAGVIVSRQRKLRAVVPDLIELLDDASPEIAKQVHQLLQQFASRDLGPRPGADHEARLAAMKAWRDWWEQRSQKQVAPKGP